MSKKISELTEIVEPTNNDVFPIVNAGETKKVLFANVINAIKTVLNNVYASITHTHTKAEITDFPTIPSKTSDLENDSGYITEETDPSVPEHVKSITEENITNWNNKQDQLTAGANITITGNVISATGGGSGEGGTTDYTALTNKPKINGVELIGDKTSEDLGIAIPTTTNQLQNDSNFISSTVVTAFWSGTQAEYDAITTKNATTLYLITEE